MAVRLDNRSDVSRELKRIRTRQTTLGLHLEPQDGPGWQVRGADISPHFEAIRINTWDKPNIIGLVVFRDSYSDVVLNLGESSRNAATLAKIGDDIWLLHTGRFWGGLNPPVWDETTEVDGRTYFKISSTTDPEFFAHVCRYYLSRQVDADSEGGDSVAAIENDTTISATEKQSLIWARRGMGKYRANLEKIEKACRVTGVSDARLLRASHIKPWALCGTNQEKLDGYNGLLLAPHIDHLFDRGYIPFEDEGAMLVSPKIDPDQLLRLGITTRAPVQVGPFHERQRPYLDFHRTLHGFSPAGA